MSPSTVSSANFAESDLLHRDEAHMSETKPLLSEVQSEPSDAEHPTQATVAAPEVQKSNKQNKQVKIPTLEKMRRQRELARELERDRNQALIEEIKSEQIKDDEGTDNYVIFTSYPIGLQIVFYSFIALTFCAGVLYLLFFGKKVQCPGDDDDITYKNIPIWANIPDGCVSLTGQVVRPDEAFQADAMNAREVTDHKFQERVDRQLREAKLNRRSQRHA